MRILFIFSVIESEKLEKPMKWGASNLVAHYKKHHLGRYEDDISKVKIHSLLKKALTLKDIAKNNVFKSGVEQETLKQILHKDMDFQPPFQDVQADRVLLRAVQCHSTAPPHPEY